MSRHVLRRLIAFSGSFTDNLQLEVLLRFDAQDWLHDSAFLGVSSDLIVQAPHRSRPLALSRSHHFSS